MEHKHLFILGIAALLLFVAVGDELGLMSIVPDPNDPIIEITSHHNGEVVYSDVITIKGAASDNNELDFIWVDVYQTGAEYRAKGTTGWSSPVQLIEGRNTIFAWARDKEFNTDLDVVNIIYEPSIPSDNLPPTDDPTHQQNGIGFSDLGFWGYLLIGLVVSLFIVTRNLSTIKTK